jgi:hypothetical protein
MWLKKKNFTHRFQSILLNLNNLTNHPIFYSIAIPILHFLHSKTSLKPCNPLQISL